ncbi:MAG TPA: glycosyltransferase [Gammaproteobacteria bacterium]|nr:glycosyltransferase [Gammaproteobacteria bacterium]
MLHLARSFTEQGRKVDLLLFRARGAYMNSVPESVRVIELGPGPGGRLLAARADPAGIGALLKPVLLPLKTDSNIRHIGALQRYLETRQPDVVLSALTYTNLVALWAKRLSGVKTPVVVSERIALSVHRQSEGRQRRWCWRFILPMVQRTYRFADGIVAVSDGVADDLAGNAHIERNSISTIYNPVVDSTLSELAAQPLQHPWFAPGQPPVILGVGRLIPQKDFHTLLHAFALLRRDKALRLVILGEGRQRPELAALAEKLGVAADLDMPGFVDNPYQYMAQASVFALTSLYEGLPGVLIQALACGCPVVSTDCPGGSAEILENGKYGRLVPVQQDRALADAIRTALDEPQDREQLKTRAALFSTDNATRQYLDLLNASVARKKP